MNICVKSVKDNSNSGETSAVAATISTTKTTKICVMKKEKKEEEEEEIVKNYHLGSEGESADQKINYGNRIKEEEVEEENDEDNKNDLDRDPLPAAEVGEKYSRNVNAVNSYESWKTGNWCWLSSRAKKDNNTGTNIGNTISCNNHQQQQQQQKQVIRNSTTTFGVKSEESCVDNDSIREDFDHKRKVLLGSVFNDDSSIDDRNKKLPPKKKLKLCQYDNGINNKNNNNSKSATEIIKKEEIEKAISNDNKDQKNKTNDTMNNNNTEKVNGIKKEEENNEYKADDIVSAYANANSNDNNNNIGDTNNINGYESWTEGNWCWLFKPSLSGNVSSSSSHGGVDFPTSTTQMKNDEDIENETNVDNKEDEEDDDDGDNGEDEGEDGSEDGNNDGYNDDNDDVTDDGYESWTEGNWCWLLPKKNKNVRSSSDITATTHAICVRRRTRTPVTKTPQKDMTYTQIQNERWDTIYQRLVAYKEKHKTTNIPQRFKEDPQLGIWISTQREYYKKETLSTHRVDLLNSMQFVWDPHGMKWNNMYQRLLTYQHKYKSIFFSRCYKEDPQLGMWVQRQRYKKEELSVERLHLLESIGFVWKRQDQVPWIETYQKLVAYKQRYQNTLVPRRYTEDPHLGHWVSYQRQSNNKGKLSERKIGLLNSIDFVWSAKR